MEVEDTQPNDSGQGNEFYDSILSDVPQEHRPYVESAIKEFDGRVTKKFQEAAEYRDQWQPYEELGINEYDPESLQSLLQFAEIANDPDTFREWWEKVGDEQGWTDDLILSDNDDDEDDDEFNKQELMEQFAQMLDERMQPLTERERAREEESRLNAAEQAIDEQMEQLKQEHGEFDEQAVYKLALAYSDEDNPIELAFKDYQSLVGDIEKGTLESKSGQPPPSEAGGRPNTTAQPITTWEDAKEAAVERFKQANAT